MTINQAIKTYPTIESDLLLTHVLGKPKEFLFLHPQKTLTLKQQQKFRTLAKRRLQGEPMAYILGYKYFYGLRFEVNKNVLIPRPETEELVDRALHLIKQKLEPKNAKPLKVLDLGTGSGCIAISLAKNLPPKAPVEIWASDISAPALNVAKKNARLHQVKIKFKHSDLLKNLNENFDVIIANLPYGWSAWKNNSSAASIGLRYEPKVALFTQEKGLKLIRQLLDQIKDLKQRPQILLLEFDPRQKNDLQKLIKQTVSRKLSFAKDYQGLWRYVVVSLH